MSTPKEPYSAAAAGAALVALAALVAAGTLTGLDRYAVHHLTPWFEPSRPHLVSLRALVVPETKPTLAGTLVGLWVFPASALVSAAIVLAARRVAYVALWVAVNVVELVGKVSLARPSLGVESFRHSYPSGHTARAFVVAAVVAWTWRRAGPVAGAWALTVPFALVALGDHTPTDVVGGALLALCLISLTSWWCTARAGRSTTASRARSSA